MQKWNKSMGWFHTCAVCLYQLELKNMMWFVHLDDSVMRHSRFRSCIKYTRHVLFYIVNLYIDKNDKSKGMFRS